MTIRWKLTQRAVNSMMLAEEIHDFVVVGMAETGIHWNSDVQRESYIEFVDELMFEIFKEGKIEQWDVRCDGRNNKTANMSEGKYVLEVSYKQRNCLNTSTLRYDISEEYDDEFEIEFH